METKDYYATLGVSRDADEKEIKRAFRRLARECHPDVNPDDAGAEERFKDANEAYEVLSDADKRAKYDRFGAAWKDWERQGGRSSDFNWGPWASAGPAGQRANDQYATVEDLQDLFGGGGVGFSDFFSQLFGGLGGAQAQRRAQPRRGQDVEQVVEVTLEEAYHGASRLMLKDGRRLEVKIPAGAATGTRIRMSGEGGGGAAGGTAGDLYLRVVVLPHARFERRGDDLATSVLVDLYTAVLGGTVRVETLSGTVTLTIPPGTQNGQTFRLKGKGMPHLRQAGQYGDLYAEVVVQLPHTLSERERGLFEELRRLSS